MTVSCPLLAAHCGCDRLNEGVRYRQVRHPALPGFRISDFDDVFARVTADVVQILLILIM
jgi:hypothetical protein